MMTQLGRNASEVCHIRMFFKLKFQFVNNVELKAKLSRKISNFLKEYRSLNILRICNKGKQMATDLNAILKFEQSYLG